MTSATDWLMGPAEGEDKPQATEAPTAYRKIADKHLPQLVAIPPLVADQTVISQNGSLLFNYRRPDGSRFTVERPDNPPRDPKTDKPLFKYKHPPGGRGLNVHRLVKDQMADTGAPLIVVEGTKQYLAVVGAALGKRLFPIGISGIRNWQWKPGGENTPSVLLPDWGYIPVAGRVCYVMPDGDYDVNKDVQAGTNGLMEALRHMGAAEVHRVSVPLVGEDLKTGVDDWLATVPADSRQAALIKILGDAEQGINDLAVKSMMDMIMDREKIGRVEVPEFLIRGWLTKHTGNRINGDPGSGKSLIALDWAACIGAGIPWNGCETNKGTVLYVVAEGLEGFAAKRVPAWERHYNRRMEGVLVYPKPLQILGKEFGELVASPEWKTFQEVCRKINPDLVIFDTQRRVMTAAGENDNSDLQVAINLLDDLGDRVGTAWLLVHHTPKGGSGGAGGGAMWGAVNTEFGMTKRGRGLEEARYVLENTKEKDEEEGSQMEFRLERYNVTPDHMDPFTDRVTSVVLVPTNWDGTPVIQEVDLTVPDGTTARDAIAMLLRRVWGERVFTQAQAYSTIKDSGLMNRQTFYRNFNRLRGDDVIVAEINDNGTESKTRFTIIPGPVGEGSDDDLE